MKSQTVLTLAVLSTLLSVLACGGTKSMVATAIPSTAIIVPAATSTAEPPVNATPADGLPVPEAPTLPAGLLDGEPPQAQPSAAHLSPGVDISLDSIHMIDGAQGWGVSGAYVLVTQDGGMTWREATPPQALPPGTETHAYGAFLDAENAWVVFSAEGQIDPQASVWHSTDGGTTWTASPPLLHQAFGDQVWAQFSLLDVEHAWLLLVGVYVGAGVHHSHDLFRTENGGITWVSLDGETSDDYTGLVFSDASNGWLTWQTTHAYAGAPPAYAVTSDGGVVWEERELPPPPDRPDLFDEYPYCETYQPVLLSPRSLRFLVGCFDAYEPPRRHTGFLYATEDGGASWTTTPLPELAMANSDQLTYFDENTALLLGREIYRSLDDGRSWTHVKTVNWDGRFSFVDSLHGWAVASANGKIALVETIDGGATWAEIHPKTSD